MGSDDEVMDMESDVKIIFVDNEMSIEQMLNACDLSSIRSHIPNTLLSARLNSCQVRIQDGRLVARGKTGPKNTERFLLLHCVDKDIQRDPAYDTLMKIVCKDLITARTFPCLESFGTGDVQHCYVYMQAAQPLQVDDALNWHIKRMEPDIYDQPSDVINTAFYRDPFPLATIIPQGSHFFTIRQQNLLHWTPAVDENVVEQDDSDLTPPAKRVKSNDHVNKFNIPFALFNDQRSSYGLAQYVFEFTDMFDVLFGINMLERAQHCHVGLVDDNWWKRRLTHELGSHVTRWSDEVMTAWQQSWLEGKPWIDESQSIELEPVEDDVREHVLSRPLWFNAAVHIATRIKIFAHDMLCQVDGSIRMPVAMCYVLSISPPFQFCTRYLMKQHRLWNNKKCISLSECGYEIDPSSVSCDPYHWFTGTEELAEETLYVALYSGTTYVNSDSNSEVLGEIVINNENEGQHDTDYDEYDPKDFNCAIREVQCDPDRWPVVEWEAGQQQIRVAHSNLHQYFIKKRVYSRCDKLNQMWDSRAAIISNKSKKKNKKKVTKKGMSESDIDAESDEEDEEEENDENEDDDEDVSKLDPHPEYAPSHPVRVNKTYMHKILEQFMEDLILPAQI